MHYVVYIKINHALYNLAYDYSRVTLIDPASLRASVVCILGF